MKRLHATRYKLYASKGFTLIELLISMTIFIIITSIAVTSFVRALRAQQAIAGLASVNDNASLTLEQMAREIRTGKDFSVIGAATLQFTSGLGPEVIYQLNRATKQIERRQDLGAPVALTASNVRIEDLRFLVLTPQENDVAPRIVISLRVGSYARDVREVYTNIQTTISPRAINF